MNEFFDSRVALILATVCIEYAGVLMAVIIDLVSGVRKARLEGKPCRSRGLRRTVSKLTSYYLALFCLSVVDVMIITTIAVMSALGRSIIEPFPYLTTAGAISLSLIETRSIIENSPHPLPIIETMRRIISALRTHN